jgi:hypothetical protein
MSRSETTTGSARSESGGTAPQRGQLAAVSLICALHS